MRKIQESEGITLLSLIVTIVVLLILSTITLNITIGENGIIKKSTEAVDAQKIAEYTELLMNVAVGDEIDRIVNNQDVDIEKLEELIGEESYVANTQADEINSVITVVTNDGYILDVIIKENGDVEIISQGKDDGEPYPQVTLSAELTNNSIAAKITAVVEESKNGIAKIELIGEESKTYNSEKNVITENYEVKKNGTYTLKATSASGKIRQRSIKVSGIRDILNEDGLIHFGEPIWSNGQVTVEITKSEPFTMQYQINGTEEENWVEYISPVSGLKHNDILYARLYIEGKGGKVSQIKIQDNIAPNIQASIGEIETSTLQIIGVTSDDNESGIPNNVEYSYWYKKSNETEYKKANTTTSDSYIFTGLTQNTAYNLKVTAQDEAGNIGEKILNSTTASLEGGVTALQFGTPSWNEGKASITVSKIDTSKKGDIQYQVNGTEEENWTNYNAAITNLDHNDTVYARLWDGTNGGSTASFTILDSISPTAPTLTIASGTAGTNSWYTSNVTVKITEGTDSQSGIGKTSYTITGAQTAEETVIASGDTINITVDGTSMVTAYTYDKAGNKSEGKTIEVKKDTEKPLSFSAGSKDITITGFTITGTTTDRTSGISKYEYYVDSAKQTSSIITGKKQDQSYTCYVRAYDNAGNYIDSSMIKITPGLWRELPNVKTDGSWDEANGVNTPKLGTGMTAIIAASENNDIWYDYKDQGTHKVDGKTSKWANARTADGSYWVWIPRFEYKIVSGYHTITAGEIDVKFIETSKTTPDSGYTIHPAFKANTSMGGYGIELPGIWVAKFEASRSNATSTSEGTNNVIKIQPGVSSWRTISMNDAFTYSYNYNRTLDSHMLKNSEWGAVTYLAHSQYGRNGNEVTINNSTSYITGNAGDSVSASREEGLVNAYNTTKGQLASTTGNIYGIYDMSGCAWEMVAAYVNNGNANLTTYSKALVNASAKYKDVFTKASTDGESTNFETNKNYIGSALYETGVIGESGWFQDYFHFPYVAAPIMLRGSYCGDSTIAGLFASYNLSGQGRATDSFRVALVPN